MHRVWFTCTQCYILQRTGFGSKSHYVSIHCYIANCTVSDSRSDSRMFCYWYKTSRDGFEMVVSSVKRVKYRVVWALKVVRVLRWWWWCGAGGIQAIAAAHWPLTSPPAGESSAAPPGQRAPNISTAADSPPFDFISTKYEHRFIIDWPGTTRKLQISPRFYPYQTWEELLVILDCWMLIFFVQMCHAVHQWKLVTVFKMCDKSLMKSSLVLFYKHCIIVNWLYAFYMQCFSIDAM